MQTHRSQSLPALLCRLAGLWLAKRWLWAILLVIGLCFALWVAHQSPLPPKVATFNIQDYPKSDRQPQNALALVDSLEVDAMGVQEITKPHHFERAVHVHLGQQWTVLFARQEVRHLVGLIFDDEYERLDDCQCEHRLGRGRGHRPQPQTVIASGFTH